jgi:hypothetical protein
LNTQLVVEVAQLPSTANIRFSQFAIELILGAVLPPPPPPPPPPPVLLPHPVPAAPMARPVPRGNEYDCCLWDEANLWRRISWRSLCPKPECSRCWPDWDPLRFPPLSHPFRYVASVPLPAPGDGDVLVTSFRVPFGWNGWLTDHFHLFTFTGGLKGVFIEGSGDLHWRIQVDRRRYLRNLGDMMVTLGSMTTPFPIEGGFLLESNQEYRYLVSAPNGTGKLPLPGQGHVFCGFFGYIYPLATEFHGVSA